MNSTGVLAGKTLSGISAGYYHACAADTAGNAYCWGLNSSGQLGNNGGSSAAPVLVGLDAPAGVSTVNAGAMVTVSWKTSASLNGSALTGYTAAVSPGGSACTITGATTCAITGLTVGTTYDVTVVAHTTAGDSGPSVPASVTVAQGPVGMIVSGYQKTKCIDDNGDSTANDTAVVIWDCNGGPGQDWAVEGDGTIQINGKCMDIYREEKTNNAPVELWTCTGRANQQWQAVNGTLVNPVSHKCPPARQQSSRQRRGKFVAARTTTNFPRCDRTCASLS